MASYVASCRPQVVFGVGIHGDGCVRESPRQKVVQANGASIGIFLSNVVVSEK